MCQHDTTLQVSTLSTALLLYALDTVTPDTELGSSDHCRVSHLVYRVDNIDNLFVLYVCNYVFLQKLES